MRERKDGVRLGLSMSRHAEDSPTRHSGHEADVQRCCAISRAPRKAIASVRRRKWLHGALRVRHVHLRAGWYGAPVGYEESRTPCQDPRV